MLLNRKVLSFRLKRKIIVWLWHKSGKSAVTLLTSQHTTEKYLLILGIKLFCVKGNSVFCKLSSCIHTIMSKCKLCSDFNLWGVFRCRTKVYSPFLRLKIRAFFWKFGHINPFQSTRTPFPATGGGASLPRWIRMMGEKKLSAIGSSEVVHS